MSTVNLDLTEDDISLKDDHRSSKNSTIINIQLEDPPKEMQPKQETSQKQEKSPSKLGKIVKNKAAQK